MSMIKPLITMTVMLLMGGTLILCFAKGGGMRRGAMGERGMRIGKEKMMAKSIAATGVGGFSAIGAALFSVGIPKNNVLKYKAAIKGGKYLVIAHGTAEEVAKAKEIIEDTEAETVESTIHHGEKVEKPVGI